MLTVGIDGLARVAIPHWLRAEGEDVGVYDAIRKSVAFVGYPTERGFKPDGTGFFALIEEVGLDFGYFVTAAHLVRDGRGTLHIRINMKDGTGRVESFEPDEWMFHPNAQMDLCAYPLKINPSNDNDPHDVVFIRVESTALHRQLQPCELLIGDEIFIASLFANRGGEKRNIPVIRVGNVAALPEEPLWPLPVPAYLIETRSLGGTSGAPVFFNMTRAPLTKAVEPRQFGVMPSSGGPGKRVIIMPYAFVGMVLSSHGGDYPSDFAGQEAMKDADFNAGISVAMSAVDVLEFLENDPAMKKQREEIVADELRAIGHRPSSVSSDRREARNPTHREDFTSLLNAAAKTKPQGDQT